MTVEPHPDPERTPWRVAPPVAAGVLAAVIFAVMLAVSPGPARTVVLVVVLVVQAALMGGRGLYLRRSARVEDRAVRWHQFFFGWSFFAGMTFLLGGASVQTSQLALVAAVLHIAAGLAFVVVFLTMIRVPKRRARRDPGA